MKNDLLGAILEGIATFRYQFHHFRDEDLLLFISLDDIVECIKEHGGLLGGGMPEKFLTNEELKEEAKKIAYLYGIKVVNSWVGFPTIAHIDIKENLVLE